MILLDYL